jgi:hypothetical protein
MSQLDEDDLHRLVKVALDNGSARSVEEARALFEGYALDVSVDAETAQQREYQIALLTTVALARRVFLGGVRVTGALDAQVVEHMPVTGTLEQAIVKLGGIANARADGARGETTPLITIGARPLTRSSDFHVRPIYTGWRGGAAPADAALTAGPAMPLAPMLGAGLAVNEAFAFVADRDAVAGRRPVGLSLWNLSGDWLVEDGAAPLELLPSRLWLIGLGHLGQAYLWALGLLPYPIGGLELVLQDIDVITRSTESTSILTETSMMKLKKTRAMAAWADTREFSTVIQERRFDDSFRLQRDEPRVALCGVDNATARRALDSAGFELVVEAGLGSGHRDFRTMHVHTLPAMRKAAEIWKNAGPSEDVTDQPAYQQMLAEGIVDRCGMTMLAGKAVGAPFVGSVAATLVISQLLRLLHGGTIDALVDLDLRSVEHRNVVPTRHDFGAFNPGYVSAVGT